MLTDGTDYMKEPIGDARRYTAKSILKIMPKKEHHNTTFTCQAQNTADRNYRSAKLRLEVKYAPKVRIGVAGGTLAGGRIAEGSEVRLSCRADANPDDLTYRWYINNEPAIGDYRTEMVREREHTCSTQPSRAQPSSFSSVERCEIAGIVEN